MGGRRISMAGRHALSAAVFLSLLLVVPAKNAAAAPQCPDEYLWGQATLLLSAPAWAEQVGPALPSDLALDMRVGDGWQPPEAQARGPFLLAQRHEPPASLSVSVQRSTTGEGFEAGIREDQSANARASVPPRPGEEGWALEVVQDSAADYQGFPSWFRRVRNIYQLADGHVCCQRQEAQREIAARTSANAYLITVHSSVSSPSFPGRGCSPLPARADFDSAAEQVRTGVTVRTS